MTTSSPSQPDQLPLYVTAYQHQLYLYKLVHNFSKTYKYTLGQELLNLHWQMLDLIILANSLPNSDKPPHIKKASLVFDQYKYRVKMAYDLKLISSAKYGYIMTVHEEMGKMLTGWLRWAKKQSA